MQNETATPKTIRDYRHAARGNLSKAYGLLHESACDAIKGVAAALDPVGDALKGRQGVSQADQVVALSNATDALDELSEQIAAADPEAVKARFIEAQAEAQALVAKAKASLEEAAKVAAERDFDAYKTQKDAELEQAQAVWNDAWSVKFEDEDDEADSED